MPSASFALLLTFPVINITSFHKADMGSCVVVSKTFRNINVQAHYSVNPCSPGFHQQHNLPISFVTSLMSQWGGSNEGTGYPNFGISLTLFKENTRNNSGEKKTFLYRWRLLLLKVSAVVKRISFWKCSSPSRLHKPQNTSWMLTSSKDPGSKATKHLCKQS